ncbi:MAG: Holliday junction resolvase RuvX [Planctomycetota bacterium]
MASVIAIDLGTKKCGFAVADALRLSITALDAVRSPGDSDALLDAVARMLRDRDVDVFLVGMPFNMDGTESGQTEWTRKAIEKLRARFPKVEIVAYDERLTSKEAESRLREEGLTFDRMVRARDSAAAAVLLEDWIAAGEPR